ncbi:MAG: hypothetical protein ACRDD4_06960 [Culicoidibacterales bacterium]
MANTVVLFIVEGETDKQTLLPCIEALLKKQTKKLKPIIVRGDLLTRYREGSTEYEVTRSNIRQKLQDYVEKEIRHATPKLKVSDIFEVYYLTDTDNCFFETTSQAVNKKLCLLVMFDRLKTICVRQKELSLNVLFMHKNLEYALYGKLERLSTQEKNRLSEQNGIRYFMNPDQLYEELIAITHWETYADSYREIQTTQERATNVNVLIAELLGK